MNTAVVASIVAKGPRDAKIVIVGEAPGADEIRKGIPFVGQSGKELDKMLVDAGIDPASCYFTNVVMTRPPDNDIDVWVQRPSDKNLGPAKRTTKGKNVTPEHWVPYRDWLVEPHVAEDARRLVEDLREINPNVIICLGNTPFWALCKEGMHGKVGTWRGSTLLADQIEAKVVPCYHPAFILRQWQHRRITVQDFRRAKAASATKELESPGWDFTIAPTFDQACAWLTGLLYKLEQGPVRMTCDVEVSQKKVICVGIGTSAKRAISIPFLKGYKFYFEGDQRHVVIRLMQKVLMHPNAQVINQNIGYDTQFLVNDFLIYPRIAGDTMIAQNVLFPGTPMNLAYQASMYCSQYRYWKDDGKFWKLKEIHNWEQLWFYNCEDCARTFEVDERQQQALERRGLVKQYEFLQKRIHRLIMKAMFRGVRVNLAAKARMLRELAYVFEMAQNRVNKLTSRRLDVSSPKQLQDFFYNEMKLPVQFSQPKKGEKPAPTCDADALVVLARLEPLVAEVVKNINLCRSYIAAIKVCKSATDPDGRWRCSYSLGLVETYRLSSSENPYDRGLNLMNISSGKDVKDADDD